MLCERGREREILGFCCSVVEIFTFLGCYVALIGSWLLMFQDCYTLVDGIDRLSQKPVTGCQSNPCHKIIPAECRPHALQCGMNLPLFRRDRLKDGGDNSVEILAPTAWCHIPDDGILCIYCHENLRSHQKSCFISTAHMIFKFLEHMLQKHTAVTTVASCNFMCMCVLCTYKLRF